MDLEEATSMIQSQSPHQGRALRRRANIFPGTELQVDICEDGSQLASTVYRDRHERTTHQVCLEAEEEETDGESPVFSELGCWTGYLDPFTSCRARPLFKSKHTRRLHSAARKLVGLHLFPLVSRSAGEVWSVFVFLLSTLVFSISLASLLLSPDVTTSDIIKVAIGGTALVLSLANVVLSLRGCHVLRGLFNKCNGTRNANDIQEEGLLPSREAPASRSMRCFRFFRDVLYDIIRLYLTEFLIHFNLAFSILDAHSSIKEDSGFSGNLQRLKLAHLVVSAMGYLLHVYIVRMVTMAATFYSIRKASHSSLHDLTGTDSARDQEDSPNTSQTQHPPNKGKWLFAFLCVYILVDMVAQGFAFASIWLKTDCENRYVDGGSTHVSGYTWAMLVVGGLIFMLGSVTWYITAYFWIQELLVHYMLGVVHKAKAAVPHKDKDTHQKLNTLLVAVLEDRCNDSIGCCRKLLFPLHTPRLILPSCLYFLAWASFIALIFFGASEGGEVVICSRSTETGDLFSIKSAVIIFGNIASNLINLPVVLVGGVWCLIALVCGLLLFLLLMAFLMIFLVAALPLVLLALYVCHD